MEEEWRPVKGYEGLYEVSNMGRVRSLPRTVRKRGNKTSLYKGKLLKALDDLYGYKNVNLSKQTIKRKKRVHRLVAEAFIPNPMNLPVVNHLDGDKHNNCVSNLEWCSNKENTNHAIKTGLMKLKIAPKPIIAYRGGEFVGIFRSMAECANKLNCDKRHIGHVIHGIRKTHHGFSFKLVNNDDLSLGNPRNYAIKVMAIKGAKIIKAKSCCELAKQLEASHPSVNSALKTGMKVKGYIIRKDV